MREATCEREYDEQRTEEQRSCWFDDLNAVSDWHDDLLFGGEFSKICSNSDRHCWVTIQRFLMCRKSTLAFREQTVRYVQVLVALP